MQANPCHIEEDVCVIFQCLHLRQEPRTHSPPVAVLLTQERRVGWTFPNPGTLETMATFNRTATMWLQRMAARLTGRPSMARRSRWFPKEADNLDFDMNFFLKYWQLLQMFLTNTMWTMQNLLQLHSVCELKPTHSLQLVSSNSSFLLRIRHCRLSVSIIPSPRWNVLTSCSCGNLLGVQNTV